MPAPNQTQERVVFNKADLRAAERFDRVTRQGISIGMLFGGGWSAQYVAQASDGLLFGSITTGYGSTAAEALKSLGRHVPHLVVKA